MRRLLAILLCVVMLFTTLPTRASASEEDGENLLEEYTDFKEDEQTDVVADNLEESDLQDEEPAELPDTGDAVTEPAEEQTEPAEEPAEETDTSGENIANPESAAPTAEPADNPAAPEASDSEDADTSEESEIVEEEQEEQTEEEGEDEEDGEVSPQANSGSYGGSLTWTLNSSGLLTIAGTGRMKDYADYENLEKIPWDYLSVKSLKISQGVTGIGDSTFANHIHLKEVTIADSVTSIGKFAFAGCEGLKSIEIPDGVKTIGKNAFSVCSALPGIELPDSLTVLNIAVFSHCTGLQSIVIPDKVEHIEQAAFFGCTGLTTVTIPGSMSFIGDDAFCGCEKLNTVYYTGPEDQWRTVEIAEGNEHLENASIHCDPGYSIDLIDGKHYNRFRHSNSNSANAGFSGITSYRLSQNYLDMLTKNYKEGEKRKAEVENNSSKWDQENWGGSCYGIAATIALTYAGLLSPGDISSSNADCYYNMAFPNWDSKLLNSIQFYFVSQDYGYGGEDAKVASVYTNKNRLQRYTGNEYLPPFLQQLVMTAQTQKAAVLGYGYNYPPFQSVGHAVVVAGYRYDKRTDTHRVILYDENCIKADPEGDAQYDEMIISKDYQYFVIPKKYITIPYINYKFEDFVVSNENFKWLELYDISKYIDIRTGDTFESQSVCAPTLRSGENTATLSFPSDKEIRITADDGSYLYSNGYELEGDMLVYSLHMQSRDAENGIEIFDYVLEVPNSSNYVITGNVDDIILNDSKNCLALDGAGIREATLSLDNNVQLTGDHYSFALVLSPGEYISSGDPGMVRIAADCEGVFQTAAEGNSVIAHADGDLSNVTTGIYTYGGVLESELASSADSFSVDTAGNVTVLPAVSLAQEYLTVKTGSDNGVQLVAAVEPESSRGLLRWYAEPADNGSGILDVSEDGFVTAYAAGTAYVTAEATVGGYTSSARCRIDVVEGEEGDAHPVAADLSRESSVSGVRLTDTKVTVELHREDYTRIQVIPELSQNNISAQGASSPVILEQGTAANTGAAVTAAEFVEDAKSVGLNDYFTLRVADDRTLEIIPEYEARRLGAENSRLLKSSYTAPISVTVDGKEFITAPVTITVKKSLPKINIKAVRLNSFMENDVQPLIFSGAEISAVEIDDSKTNPDWLTLGEDGRSVVYTGAANANFRDKLNLLVQPEGWVLRMAVTVAVSAAKTAPKLTLKPASLKMLPTGNDTVSTVAAVAPAGFETCEICQLSITEGQRPAEDELNVTVTGREIVISAGPGMPDDGKAHTYRVTLGLMVQETASATAVLTVRLSAKKAPTMALKTSGTIDLALPGSYMSVVPSVKNVGGYTVCQITEVTDAAGKDVTGFFNVDGLTLKAADRLEPGRYKASLTLKYGTKESISSSVSFTVKRSAKAPKPSVKLRLSGGIDVIRPGSSVTVTPTIKNCFTHTLSVSDLRIWRLENKVYKDVTDSTDNPFSVALGDGVYIIRLKPDSGVNHQTDKFKVSFAANENGVVLNSPQTAMTVKMGPAKILQSTGTVTLVKTDRYSSAPVMLTLSDETLAGIDWERTLSAFDQTENPLFQLEHYSGDSVEIHYANHLITKGGKVTIPVYMKGNVSSRPNATIKVNVKLV